MALVGVGATDRSGSGHIYQGWMTPGLARELHDAGAVGHICGHHFNSGGHLINSSLAACTLTIDPDALHTIPRVLGVAWGSDKVRALFGALRGRYLNVLITDEDTAVALLKGAGAS
jgi:DNA-binding transcriptional regulator LsrR (DeoR family)